MHHAERVEYERNSTRSHTWISPLFSSLLFSFCCLAAAAGTAVDAGTVRICNSPRARKWIADFTYVWTAEGWLYVAAVVDLFSRRVVGWSMSAGKRDGRACASKPVR